MWEATTQQAAVLCYMIKLLKDILKLAAACNGNPAALEWLRANAMDPACRLQPDSIFHRDMMMWEGTTQLAAFNAAGP